MNVERFRAMLDLMTDLNRTLKIQTSVDQIRDSLANITGSPAQPSFQTALATALESLTEASEKLGKQVTPEQFALINELGGSSYFDPNLAKNLKAEIAANAMTPSIPRDSVQTYSTKRAEYVKTIENTLAGLRDLGIEGEELQAGTADVSFAIPYEIFDSELGRFAKELIFLDRLMKDFGEALSGGSETIHLESLSSSTPTVTITAGIKMISALADLVSKFLTVWEKVQKYRDARQNLTELGLSGKALEEITDQITTTIEEVVEESVELTLSGFNGDTARKNELRNALVQDTRRLFGQIERGLTVQFRAKQDGSVDDENAAALKTIQEAGQGLTFPAMQSEPMLLANGSVVEGEVPVFTYVKKTTSKKTTRRHERSQ